MSTPILEQRAELRTSPSLRLAIFMLFCAAMALLIPFLSNPWLYGLVAGMFACFVTPVWFSRQSGRFDVFESVHAMGFRYFVYFGLGAVWTWQDPWRIAYDRYIPPYLVPAAAVCLVGFVAFLGGYYAPWFRPRPARNEREIPTGMWFVLIPGAVGFGGTMAASMWAWASWAGVSLAGFISSLGQLAPLYYFSWSLCWMLVLAPHTPALRRRLLLAVFVPATLLIVFSDLTDKSRILMMGVVPLFALWYTRRKFPWKTLTVVVLILVFVVFPFANTIRIVDPNLDTTTRVEITSNMISHWDTDHYLFASLHAAKQRLSLINSVAVVIRDVPRWVPYAEGRTLFYPTLAYFVPRILWPDKPRHTLGREFGVTFRVVQILDNLTSIAPTVPGELYWNFDVPGVVIGMALWGMLLRVLYRRYGEAEFSDPVRQSIHVVLLVEFLHFGGGISAQTVAILRILALLEGYRWIARRAGLVRLGAVTPREIA